mmetsp:Transcript_51842/g.52810  ORF Transcript_51842/g.52810 Transcript_51842/m.52810 type:complete len:347 (+) Transcript_51842:100-1140(+)
MFESMDVTGNDEDNQLWSALTGPLNSLVGIEQSDSKVDDNNNKSKNKNTVVLQNESQKDADLKRYRKRYQSLREEVDEVSEEATKTRKKLWEAQDNLKEANEKVRELENHLNEVLELREKDLETIKTLQIANTECAENENRARESTEIFKKVYKRAQLKIKEDEEEIAILREQRDTVIREKNCKKGIFNSGHARTTDEMEALEQIKIVSENKEKTLKNMLFQAEREAELWKSKHKVAVKRVKNSREQILAMEDPTRATSHMEKQRIEIEELENQLSSIEEKIGVDQEDRDEERDTEENNRNRSDASTIDMNVLDRAYCDEDLDNGLTRDLINRIQKLSLAFSSTTE